MSGPARKKILEMIEKTKDLTRADHSSHSFSMGSPEHSRGFSFITVANKAKENLHERIMSFSMLKKYSEKSNEWFGLGWSESSTRIVDAAVSLKFEWQQDDRVQELANQFLRPGKRVNLRDDS